MFERVDQQIRDDFDKMVEALSGLLSIPSCKGTALPDAPFGAETRQALDEMLRLGGQMGFTTRAIDNMAGYVEFGTGEKMVAALGHLDVVPPGDGWTGDPFVPVVTRDRIVARGAIDDKGPVIACLFAMKALRDAGYEPPARIRLIVGLDEESGSSCMARYTRTEELPAAGFTPDASFPAIYAEKGILHLAFRMEDPTSLHRPTGPVVLRILGGDRANVSRPGYRGSRLGSALQTHRRLFRPQDRTAYRDRWIFVGPHPPSTAVRLRGQSRLVSQYSHRRSQRPRTGRAKPLRGLSQTGG